MSDYYDRRTSVRDRRRDDDYYDDASYSNTRANARSTALVKRRDDSPEYDEEVRRDFSPGGGYYRETTIRKSGTRPAGGRARSVDYEDDRSFASSRKDSNYGSRNRPRNDDRRSSYRSNKYERYSDESSRSRSRSPPPKRDRRKSMPEEALEAVGLGGLAATLMGKKNRSRSGSRDRQSKSRGRNSSDHRKEQMQQALKAAVLAGAGAAFLARKEDGPWTGDKGKRILTAAIAAGGVDGFINRDKDPEQHKLRDTVGSAIAGLATNRLVNGREQSRGPDGRAGSPDRQGGRSRSKVGELLAAGGVAAAAKKLADNVRGRSQSRNRGRSRSRSYDSYDDSRSPPPQRSRSRSIVASGLSKLGMNDRADRVDPAGARARSQSRGGGARSRSRGRYNDDDYADDRRGGSIYDPPSYNGRGSSVYDDRNVSNSQSRDLDPHSGAMTHRPQGHGQVGPGGGVLSPPPPGYHYDTGPRHNGDPETDSDSDLGSSSDDEKLKHKGRKRLLVSGGLATVATIHAGHSVYQSIEKRQARKRALADGTISKEDAKKHKNRDRMQDAASVGLAALGLKGAYSEWKEMKETHEEHKEAEEALERHAMKREARRQKLDMVGMHEQHSNSAPTFHEPQYGGHQDNHGGGGTYMSGGNAEHYRNQPQAQYPYQPQQGPYMNGAGTQYHDGNPYGWAETPPPPQQQFHSDAPYTDAHGGQHFPPPPVQGGTGFPPPPGSQPPPQQGV